MTRIDRRFEPRDDVRAVHDATYAAYRDRYPATAPILRRLTRSTTGTGPAIAAEVAR
jgi:hypothetical protein